MIAMIAMLEPATYVYVKHMCRKTRLKRSEANIAAFQINLNVTKDTLDEQ